MIKTCYCGNKFKAKSSRHVNCSIRCKNIKKSKKYRDTHDITFNCVCIVCGISFNGYRKNTKHCSPKCCGISRRKYLDIPQCLENADRKLDKRLGYVRVYCPMHREANSWGYVYEHRLIAEKMIGRRLKKNEVVHHKNGKRWDNRTTNLVVMSKQEHSRLKNEIRRT